MESSNDTNKLYEALAKAQGEFSNPKRNAQVKVTMKTGGSYFFTYATLDSIVAMVRPVLEKHGLCIVQGLNSEVVEVQSSGHVITKATVTTRIGHSSGQWIQDTLSGVAEGSDIQDLGAAVTYLRRYSICSMLNIVADEDDDGAGASGRKSEPVEQRPPLPECPDCKHNNFVIVGKPEYGGGYLCYKQKGGCGAKWGGEEKKPARKSSAKSASAPAAEAGSEPLTNLQIYDKGMAAILAATSHDTLTVCENRAETLFKEGTLTREQADKLLHTAMTQRKFLDRQREAMTNPQLSTLREQAEMTF